jgi:hypothetical protein
VRGHIYKPSDYGGRDRRIPVQGQPGDKADNNNLAQKLKVGAPVVATFTVLTREQI